MAFNAGAGAYNRRVPGWAQLHRYCQSCVQSSAVRPGMPRPVRLKAQHWAAARPGRPGEHNAVCNSAMKNNPLGQSLPLAGCWGFVGDFVGDFAASSLALCVLHPLLSPAIPHAPNQTMPPCLCPGFCQSSASILHAGSEHCAHAIWRGIYGYIHICTYTFIRICTH